MNKHIGYIIAFCCVIAGCRPAVTAPPDYTTPALSEGHSTVIYSQTQSTVNDVPFIPLGIYGVNIGDMPAVRDFGFNLVQNYGFFNMSEEEQKKYLDTAGENGLMVFAGLNGTSPLTDEYIAKMKHTVMTHKEHPALYAWYLADEPKIADTDPEKFRELYDWIKETDPCHPVISSNWELQNFKDACDADMRQLYDGVPHKLTPTLESYLSTENKGEKTWVAILNSYDSGWVSPGVTEPTLNPTSAFRELTGKGIKDGDPEWEAEELKWKPLVEHLDNPTAAGFSTTGSFPDTPEKIRGAFYWAFVHGSNGFYYWLFTNPKDSLNLRWGWYTLFYQPRLCSAVRSTLSEIRELSGFLINPLAGSTSYKNPENPGLFVWSKSYGGKRIVIVVNETGQELSGASVDLRPLGLEAQTAAVFKEDGRKILIDGGIMKDSFRTDEAHVYFVE